MILFIVLPALLGITFFIPWTLGKMFALQRTTPLYIFFGILTAIIPLVIWVNFTIANKLLDLAFLATCTWVGFLLYLFILLVLYHILKIFLPLPPFKSGVIILAATVFIMVYSTVNAFTLNTKEIQIPIKGLKHKVKIALASDMHINTYRNKSYILNMINKINEFHPDFTVFAGDIADSNAALEEDTFSLFKRLTNPSYFVLGNHDIYLDTAKLIKLMTSSGVSFMQNDIIERDGIQLIGLDYMNADKDSRSPHRVESKETIKSIMPQLHLSKDLPKIIINHRPNGLEYITKYDVDLVLAGHTHGGGQIFPITIISPYMNLNEYISGLYQVKDTLLYVSEGVGTFFVPMRLGTKNELTLITLTTAK